MKLSYTRAMVKAAIEGKLEDTEMMTDDIFGLHIPVHVPGVPDHILQPENTWSNKKEYREKALYLANEFKENFKNSHIQMPLHWQAALCLAKAKSNYALGLF